MTEQARFLLDTHAALWLQLEPTRLGPRARRSLAGVSPEHLFISDVTISETARLLSTGRLETTGRPDIWLERFALGFTTLPVTPSIAWAAAAFPWEHRDPCDRHILATAAMSSLPLVTLDPKITSFASKIGVPIVW